MSLAHVQTHCSPPLPASKQAVRPAALASAHFDAPHLSIRPYCNPPAGCIVTVLLIQFDTTPLCPVDSRRFTQHHLMWVSTVAHPATHIDSIVFTGGCDVDNQASPA